MKLTLQPTTVASECGDSRAKLASLDGRLIAVLARLGSLHGDLAGRWFVEASFGTRAVRPGETFASLQDFEAYMLKAIEEADSPTGTP